MVIECFPVLVGSRLINIGGRQRTDACCGRERERERNECVQMPGKMARSDPRPGVRVTRGAGSGQHLASVLKEGRENANIDAGLGFIWRISDYAALGRD